MLAGKQIKEFEETLINVDISMVLVYNNHINYAKKLI